MRHRSMRVFMNDDRHVMAKHSVIYPSQEELENVQNMVSHTERALKAVSDWLDKEEKGSTKSESDSTDADKERFVIFMKPIFYKRDVYCNFPCIRCYFVTRVEHCSLYSGGAYLYSFLQPKHISPHL